MVYGLVTSYFILIFGLSAIIAPCSVFIVVIYILLLSVILFDRRDVGGQEFGGMYCALLFVK